MKLIFEESSIITKFNIVSSTGTITIDSKQAIDLAVQISKFFSVTNKYTGNATANITEVKLTPDEYCSCGCSIYDIKGD